MSASLVLGVVDAFLAEYTLRLLLLAVSIAFIVLKRTRESMHWRWSTLLASTAVLAAATMLFIVASGASDAWLSISLLVELAIMTWAAYEVLKEAIAPQLAFVLAFVLATLLLFFDLTGVERLLPIVPMLKVLVAVSLFFLIVFFLRFLL